ncbi:MAG: DUF4301 family protein [Firmicutes bacterium]|nr:DUF4301 family protein [Bacillota bacterium]MCM1400777.1 DUF4301 family protein [Bacteroides sp.]MCM1477859.1 DUF4301 family protein [Bacteroides sp.]
MLSQEDIAYIEERGMDLAQVEAQLKRFETGFPYLKIKDAARQGQGITVLDAEGENKAIERWKQFLADGGDVCKFVPASGAASRMFKALFAFVDGDAQVPAEGSDVANLIANIEKVAFIDDLNATTARLYAKSVAELKAEGRYKELIAAIIKPEGMNYGGLPKGLLKFHAYPQGSRTPVEEQLAEGAQTAANGHGDVKMHFTVSANHRKLFEEKIEEVADKMAAERGVNYHISLSEQKPQTDTVAANPDNTPFHEDGHLLFRPGGHGALIENLNDIDATVVFIKNIDNVVPDSLRGATVRYKQVIGGYLIELHDRVVKYLDMLATGNYTRGTLQDMLHFLHTEFSISDRSIDGMNDVDVAMYCHEKLNRPLRVCGMVKNEGEPGGGPFIAFNRDGSASLQILESTQIDPDNAEYMKMMATATHFNPVDLVCYVKDRNGDKFDLRRYVDPDTGFISSKSSHGKELRAMELPGLWNGAMSDWNTAFVEVPIDTFNPVKTVNDLLRPAHQG